MRSRSSRSIWTTASSPTRPDRACPRRRPVTGAAAGGGTRATARDWVRSQLKDLGVTTFGDLALDDADLPEERRYKLVVTVADVTTGQLVRLP